MVVVVVVFVMESRVNDQKWRVVEDLYTMTGANRMTINSVLVPFDEGSRKRSLNWLKKKGSRRS
jgi:hypothetical protein